MKMRKIRKPIKNSLYLIASLALLNHYVWYTNDLEVRRVEMSAPVIVDVQALEMPLESISTDILITNYFLGDGSSGTTTASGKQIKDFQVNEEGMYTYNGMIVVATANTNRLSWSLKDGYKSHDLYSVLDIEINGKSYEGIVLDVCGSCFGVEGEEAQRYDVFTTGNVIGKVEGKLNGYTTRIQN